MLQSFSLTIRGAGLFRVDAPNGAGKSTLIEVLSGYLRPLAGGVLINGHLAHTGAARARRRVCRTAPALFPHMNVEDHLAFASRLTGSNAEEVFARADRLGLADWLSERADRLSTGSARKLWYIMCTTGDFDVVALDEPFNGLDDLATQIICEELSFWSHERLVLITCHAVPARLRITANLSLA